MKPEDNEISELCTGCGERPPAGYVARYGIYLPHLCVKCYRKYPDDDETQKNPKTMGLHKQAAR